MNNLGPNTIEWPEWFSLFIATVDRRPIPDSEKSNHMKTLLAGKPKSIWRTKLGRPHNVINDVQFKSLRKASQVNLTTQQLWSVFQLLSHFCECAQRERENRWSAIKLDSQFCYLEWRLCMRDLPLSRESEEKRVDRKCTNSDKQFWRTLTFSARSNKKETR